MFAGISQKTIACRVRSMREKKGWTQDQLAQALKLNDRQSISDIEKGKRPLKVEELLRLSDLLDGDIGYFINPFSVEGEAQYSWRASSKISDNTLRQFEDRANQWVGLFRWLKNNISPPDTKSPFKTSLHLSTRSSYDDVICCAENLVKSWGLGQIPTNNLIERIEKDLDIPVLFVDQMAKSTDGSMSGLTCQLDDFCVILINRNEAMPRQFFTLAHELFHALTWDAIEPEYHESNEIQRGKKIKRSEQLANNFAVGLLMPKHSLDSLIDRQQLNDISYLMGIAQKLQVTPSALAWRLFNEKIIGKEICDQLLEARANDNDSSQTTRLFSSQFVGMLHQAINSGKLSARKAAKIIGVTLPKIGELFADYSLTIPIELEFSE